MTIRPSVAVVSSSMNGTPTQRFDGSSVSACQAADAAVLFPDGWVARDRQNLFWQLARGEIRKGHVFEHGPDIRAHRDPHVFEPPSRALVLESRGANAAHAGKRPRDSADHIGDGDCSSRTREPESSVRASRRLDQLCALELQKDVLEKVHGDRLSLGDLLAFQRLGTSGCELDHRPDRIVFFRRDPHRRIVATQADARRVSEPRAKMLCLERAPRS